MKLLLSPIALFVFASAAHESTKLVYAPDEGTVLKRVFEAKAEYHLARHTLTVDGETHEPKDALPEFREGFDEHIAVTDKITGVSDGRPTEILRTFDELGQVSHASNQEEDRESESPLHGRVVRFSWDEGAGSFRVAAADDHDLDEALSSELLEDMDLRLVLPTKEVAAGDEWALDPKLYLAFMWPSGLLDFHAADEEPSDLARQTSHQTIEHLEGSGTARLEEVREEGGVHVAVIHVELTITTGSEHEAAASEEDSEDAGPAITFKAEIAREITGTILWDVEHGHARSAELECTASRTDSRSATVHVENEDGEQADLDVVEADVMEGTIHYTATIEREER